ncbi:unnamed protein product [Pedinophyceae sp. YPF-701]|nr:unnamed protein product [Pedinophyceae sp. YPF-701]
MASLAIPFAHAAVLLTAVPEKVRGAVAALFVTTAVTYKATTRWRGRRGRQPRAEPVHVDAAHPQEEPCDTATSSPLRTPRAADCLPDEAPDCEERASPRSISPPPPSNLARLVSQMQEQALLAEEREREAERAAAAIKELSQPTSKAEAHRIATEAAMAERRIESHAEEARAAVLRALQASKEVKREVEGAPQGDAQAEAKSSESAAALQRATKAAVSSRQLALLARTRSQEARELLLKVVDAENAAKMAHEAVEDARRHLDTATSARKRAEEAAEKAEKFRMALDDEQANKHAKMAFAAKDEATLALLSAKDVSSACERRQLSSQGEVDSIKAQVAAEVKAASRAAHRALGGARQKSL